MCNKAQCEIQSMIVKPFPLANGKTHRFLAWGPKQLKGVRCQRQSSQPSGSVFLSLTIRLEAWCHSLIATANGEGIHSMRHLDKSRKCDGEVRWTTPAFQVSGQRWHRALTVWSTGGCSVFYSWAQWIRVTLWRFMIIKHSLMIDLIAICHAIRKSAHWGWRCHGCYFCSMSHCQIKAKSPRRTERVIKVPRHLFEAFSRPHKAWWGLSHYIVSTRRVILKCRSQRDDASAPCEIPL